MRLWALILCFVGLSLLGALMAPSRTALLGAMLLLLLPPAVLRPEWIVPSLLILLPFYTVMRRLFLLREPTVLSLDPLILLPDLLVVLAAAHLLLVPFRSRRLALGAWLLARTLNARSQAPGGRYADPGRSRERSERRQAPSAVTAVDLLVLLLLAIVVLGLVVGMRNGVVPALNGMRMFGLYIALYFLARRTFHGYRQVGTLFAITAFTGLLTGGYGIYQTIVGLPAYDQIYFENTPAKLHVIGGFVRAFSTFQFTSHFSVFMLIAFFCALTLVQQRRAGRALRLVCLAALPTTLAAVAVTFVRSTWIGLGAGLATYLLLRFVRRPLLRTAIVLVLIPVAWFFLGRGGGEGAVGTGPASDLPTQVLQARAQSVLVARADTDLAGRYQGLQAALRAAGGGLLGLGLGSTSAERFGGNMIAWTGDSQITTLLVELGWPGLLCFFGVLVFTLRRNLRAIDTTGPGDVRTALVGIASILVGLTITSLTGGPLWYTQPTCVYGWLLTGIAVNAMSRQAAPGSWLLPGSAYRPPGPTEEAALRERGLPSSPARSQEPGARSQERSDRCTS
jgi:hypothetical protein